MAEHRAVLVGVTLLARRVEVIGLAGEIYVLEMPRRRYGNDVVTALTWISSISRLAFDDNPHDDGAGCDFAFTAGGRSYKVEVKASAGNEPAFTLGSSEIALAMELANRKKGLHGIEWVL